MKIKTFFASLLVGLTMLIGSAVAQVSVGIGIGPVGVAIGEPPVCVYGYYDYEPYACAPFGFYGDGYFYNGIFLGVGPWGNWGYSHGWGEHRFRGGGRGDRYRGGRGNERGHARGSTQHGNNSRRGGEGNRRR